MKCTYLNQFGLTGVNWTVASCMANDHPYSPSISELHDYCKGHEYGKCSIFLKKETAFDNGPVCGNAVAI